jgi:hypothetical protein
MNKVKTRIYFCGGTGLNIGSQFSMVHPDCSFVDTSRSNLSDNISPTDLFITEGTDGAGADRRYILPIVEPQIPSVLERFQPGDFNVVVFSAAGGSGSVIGPLLMRDLLTAGEAAVAVVIGADDSTTILTNTINTIKSLESMSIRAKAPLAMMYQENVNGVPFAEVDAVVLQALDAMVLLTNQNNDRLDTKDVSNWVQFHKLHPIAPQLCTLYVEFSRQDAAAILEPIAVASLFNDADKVSAFGNPYSRTVGIVRDTHAMPADQLHFVINTVGVDETMKSLEERRTEQTRTQSNWRQRKPVVSQDDHLSQSGIVA